MKTNLMNLAEEYYQLVGKKDAEGIEKYLHPNVEFRSPLSALKGKPAFVEAVSNFMKALESLVIRAKFGEGNQAVIVYDVIMPGMTQCESAVALLDFQDKMIVKIELFFDGKAFES
ncbi:MAG: nuclear transport factor 2 family protein [Chlamydiia bacterium]|nr:nuclear transport factor 2 family protein [Chlamydiia bacterium]